MEYRAYFNNGKIRKEPFLLKFIYEHPGCTRDDIQEYSRSLGFTAQNSEFFSWLSYDNNSYVDTQRQGNGKTHYYPTKELENYIKKVNFDKSTSNNDISSNENVQEKYLMRSVQRGYESRWNGYLDFGMRHEYIGGKWQEAQNLGWSPISLSYVGDPDDEDNDFLEDVLIFNSIDEAKNFYKKYRDYSFFLNKIDIVPIKLTSNSYKVSRKAVATIDSYSDNIDEDDIYSDDNELVYGSKTIGYFAIRNGDFEGGIHFIKGLSTELKKAALHKLNSSFYRDYLYSKSAKYYDVSGKVKFLGLKNPVAYSDIKQFILNKGEDEDLQENVNNKIIFDKILKIHESLETYNLL